MGDKLAISTKLHLLFRFLDCMSLRLKGTDKKPSFGTENNKENAGTACH
jgi:hypothetical protein